MRLGLSPETVKTHVASMLSKLGLDDRRALAAWQPEAAAGWQRLLALPFLPVRFASRAALKLPTLLGSHAPWLVGSGVLASLSAAMVVLALRASRTEAPATLPVVPETTASITATPTNNAAVASTATVPPPRPQVIRGRVLFLASPDLAPNLEPRFTQVDGSVVPVSRVADMDSLMVALGDDVTAIVIEHGMVGSLDRVWLQERFTEGRAIIGLNVPMGELIDILYPAVKAILRDLGWKRNEPAFYKPPTTFFSVVMTGGPVMDLSTCSGGYEWPYGPDSGEGGLVAGLRSSISCVPQRFGANVPTGYR